MTVPRSLSRRGVLVAGGSGLASLAGCLGGPADGGPRERAYTLTITRPGETLELRVEPAGEVADVIQVNVGDTVEFAVQNDAGVPVGFHNHADDAEFVVEPGATQVTSFEAADAMTGRHEIEGWVASAGNGGGEGHDDGGGEHGEGATTLAVIEVRPRGS